MLIWYASLAIAKCIKIRQPPRPEYFLAKEQAIFGKVLIRHKVWQPEANIGNMINPMARISTRMNGMVAR